MTVGGQQTTDVAEQVLAIGGKLKVSPSNLMVNTAFADGLKNEAALFISVGLVDIAHTLVAIELHAIPEASGRELLSHLLALQNQPESFTMTAAKGDIYTNREAWLAERTDTVVWLGAGRARREAVTTAFVLTVRQQLTGLVDSLIGLASTIIAQSERHLSSVMPDYTYLQAAQPTTFGHYLLGFTYPIIRDIQRLEALLGRINRSPMGCGSTNGSRLRQGRERLAELLGFEGLASHARDAMWQADVFLEAAAVLTACSINLSRLAEDLQVFSSLEFALVELDDRHARASKIMPQKKNPFALTYIRGIANKLIGLSTSVAASVRTPTGQPDNRSFIYGELPEAITTIQNASALMAEVLQTIAFNHNRGKALVLSGWALATDLAESLMLVDGMDFRSAHYLVAYLANEYRDKSLPELDYSALLVSAEKVLGHSVSLTEEQFNAALDLTSAIQARCETGGTATTSMMVMLADCRQQLLVHQERNLALKNRFICKKQALLDDARQQAILPDTRYGKTDL